ncbi:MAG: hypothetical protein ACYDG2_09395 [Ruminiclostridium sp.]
MGIASMVIGIVSTVLGFIPLCGNIAFIPAIVGLILGIVDVVMKSKKGLPKGQAIAGIILCSISIVIIMFYNIILVASASV